MIQSGVLPSLLVTRIVDSCHPVRCSPESSSYEDHGFVLSSLVFLRVFKLPSMWLRVIQSGVLRTGLLLGSLPCMKCVF